MATSVYAIPSHPSMITPVIIDLRVPPKPQDKPKHRDSIDSSPSSDSASLQGFAIHSETHISQGLNETDGVESDSSDESTDATSITSDGLESRSGTSESDHEPENAAPEFDLRSMILSGLCPSTPGAHKTIPTMVLYDDRGLQIYDDITHLEEYYLFNEEIQILERDGDKIVENIPDNSVVVELGSGSLRKTALLLRALEKKRRNIRYYALDLMLDELTKSLKSLGQFNNVKTAGLWGTYDQGLAFVNSFGPDVPKTLLWLGSSIGNINRDEAKEFMASYRKTLNVGDNWLIGIDRRNDPRDITIAYNDPKGVTREFIMNGLDHINTILGQDFIDRTKFRYFARYNEEIGRHEAYYQVTEAHELVYRDPTSADQQEIRVQMAKDELINVEFSYKWSLAESTELFDDTEFTRIEQWTSDSNRYDLHLVRKTPFYFKLAEPAPCPTPAEWEELWKSWDLITMHMIRHPSMLLEKPIALRHPFLFYLGHIPTFLDMQLSRALNENFTEPSYFSVIFERGIDPDVEDPTQCHAHSVVPDSWPEIETIVDYRDRVRARLLRVLTDRGTYPMTRRLARVLFMGFEHEAMHLETLVYMLVQSPNTAPPPLSVPWTSGEVVSSGSPSEAPSASWISINPSQLDKSLLTLGHDDLEAKDLEDRKNDLDSEYGWDNENPLVAPDTPSAYKIQSRQVTNSEYLSYLQATGQLNNKDSIPTSWLVKQDTGSVDDIVGVKSVFGPVPLSVSGKWPVSCSNVQATGYAAWISKRDGVMYSLPTEHELTIAFKWRHATVPRSGLENYGFRQWHPCLEKPKVGGAGSSSISNFSGPGGLWDWTSTPFAPLVSKDEFQVSKLYPGYSSDFFDDKHMVVLGGSWATHPRIAERRSFRNWYQGNYPFVFAGFRLVQHC
ncbi:hypothetical protein B0O80DRAFT_443506 [Mortierella sp. GBAus27b]|nr:hypothetical protein BGX31_001099 [Mortierella sp. GBA43]KAI8357934.1 hypothetical protein B0O80DRAFT_443506 [Mortierella sp. GBAus27b]